jgi:hypothetical protein
MIAKKTIHNTELFNKAGGCVYLVSLLTGYTVVAMLEAGPSASEPPPQQTPNARAPNPVRLQIELTRRVEHRQRLRTSVVVSRSIAPHWSIRRRPPRVNGAR